MTSKELNNIFTEDIIKKLFPADRTDRFFEALYGDASEGAYDISLSFSGHDRGNNELLFNFNLHQRPGKCLACNLTRGLPEVFARHPIINVRELIEKIAKLAGLQVDEWQLGATSTVSRELNTIPLILRLK